MNDTAPRGKFIDWIALFISILAAGFTGSTLYYGHLRGPHLVASAGNYIYVQGRPRIGIPVSIFNDGAQVGVINSGRMTISDGSNTFFFRLTLLSPSTEKWVDEGGKITPVPTILSLFSQIAVKGGDATEGVFWYDPKLSDFKFRADTDYNASLIFLRREDAQAETIASSPLPEKQVCLASVSFRIAKVTAENAALNPEVVIPIQTAWRLQP
jgi:hypothetical protein